MGGKVSGPRGKLGGLSYTLSEYAVERRRMER